MLDVIFTCEDIMFSCESSPCISLVFISQIELLKSENWSQDTSGQIKWTRPIFAIRLAMKCFGGNSNYGRFVFNPAHLRNFRAG